MRELLTSMLYEAFEPFAQLSADDIVDKVEEYVNNKLRQLGG